MESHNEKTILVHWVYTREEWKIFVKREKRKKGLFHWIMHWLSPGTKKIIPEVRITPEKISVGNIHYHFNNSDNKLKRINIIDTGLINLMEISYGSLGTKFTGSNEIRVPIPKGKLREAINIQNSLMEQPG